MVINLSGPRDSDTHSVADFAELLCLSMIDSICSADTIQDYIEDMTDQSTSDLALLDCFAHLAWRAKAYGEWYPFQINESGRVIQANGEFSDRHRLYAFFLFCSSLPCLQKSHHKILTDGFEKVSIFAFKNMWPVEGTVLGFGKNVTGYKGQKWERLNALGRDLGGRPQCKEGTFRPNDTGDGGIDIAAWLDLDEYEKENIPTALAQCACSREDWVRKQSEICNSRLGNQLFPTHPWMQVLFIPHSFRAGSGHWAFYGDIGETIVVDRLRLANCLEWSGSCGELELPDALDDFIDFKLDLV